MASILIFTVCHQPLQTNCDPLLNTYVCSHSCVLLGELWSQFTTHKHESVLCLSESPLPCRKCCQHITVTKLWGPRQHPYSLFRSLLDQGTSNEKGLLLASLLFNENGHSLSRGSLSLSLPFAPSLPILHLPYQTKEQTKFCWLTMFRGPGQCVYTSAGDRCTMPNAYIAHFWKVSRAQLIPTCFRAQPFLCVNACNCAECVLSTG